MKLKFYKSTKFIAHEIFVLYSISYFKLINEKLKKLHNNYSSVLSLPVLILVVPITDVVLALLKSCSQSLGTYTCIFE